MNFDVLRNFRKFVKKIQAVLQSDKNKGIFIVAPCILKIHQLLKPTNALLCILFTLKLALKHLKSSYMFRSIDHHQGVHVVPC
jgi:hypothetical protein